MPDSDPSPPPPPPELEGLDPADLLARGLESNRRPTGATGWVPPTPAELALLLPQYQIESLIGHGGMGAVYKGFQTTLERAVAIKLLPAEMASDEQFISRFQREARTLARLHHPSIVAVHDFGRTSAGHLYFVMEFVDGMDLRRVLRTSGLPPDDALKLIVQICDALQAAHKQGVVHRDIKPENILITNEGYVKLVDFGIARPLDEDHGRLTMSGMMVGTPDYMSPEQRTGEADERTDIYALGVVLYELLTGRPPRGVFPAPSRRVQIDVRIDEVVLKALQDDPEARYQKVSDMKTDVDRIRTTSAVTAAPTAPTAAPVAPPLSSLLLPFYRQNKTRLLAGAAVLGSLLLLLVAVYQFGKAARSTKSAANAPGVDWHVPGLNEKNFGGWSAFGGAGIESRDGVVTLTGTGGSSGIASGRSDITGDDLHVEIAGSPDVVAWIGVRMNGGDRRWTGITSYVNGYQEQVYEGHAGLNFASEDYQGWWKSSFESGTGRLHMPVNEFFSLDFSVSGSNELTTRVNDRPTSVLTNIASEGKGQVVIFVKKGALRLRKIELRKHEQAAELAAPVVVARTLRVPEQYPRIQDAVDAALPGDTVRVRAGVYTQTFKFKTGINVVGEGMDRSIVRAPDNDDHALIVQDCASGWISDLSLENTRDKQPAVVLLASDVELRRCRVRSARDTGITCGYHDRSLVQDCEVTGCGLDGIAGVAKLAGNFVHDNKRTGILSFSDPGVYLLGNTSQGNGQDGIELSNFRTPALLHGNRCLDNGRNGIRVDGNALALSDADLALLTGNKDGPVGGSLASAATPAPAVPATPARTLRVPANYARIQSAIDAARPGDTVEVAAGDYTERLIFKDGINLVGEDKEKTTIHCNAEDHALSVFSCHGGRIENLGFMQTKDTTTKKEEALVLLVTSAVEVQNCAVRNSRGPGVQCQLDDQSVVRNCVVGECGDGIRVSHGAKSRLIGNHITDSGACGISVGDYGTAPTLSGNVMSGNHWYGIAFWYRSGGVAENNLCERNFFAGICVGDGVTAPTLTGNTARGNDRSGILFKTGSGGLAENNVSEQNGEHGICLEGDSSAPTLHNNHCRENQEFGVFINKGNRPIGVDTTEMLGNKRGAIRRESGAVEAAATPATASSPPVAIPADTARMKQIVNVQFARSVTGFATGDDKRWHIDWANGEYQMLCKEGGLWIPGEPLLEGLHLNDFVCEIRARIVRAADGGWGLALVGENGGAIPSPGIMLNATGIVSSRSYDSRGEEPWTATPMPLTPAANPGDQANTLRIEAFGSRFRVFLNGQFAGECNHPRLQPASALALFSYGRYPPQDVRFQSVSVWVPQ